MLCYKNQIYFLKNYYNILNIHLKFGSKIWSLHMCWFKKRKQKW